MNVATDSTAEIGRLQHIIEVLMDRAEGGATRRTSDVGSLETAVLLEEEVRYRTLDLETALRDNERMTRALQRANEELEQLHARLREQALRDSLTGLYNRHYLDELFAREVERVRRSGHPLCVAMADIDHFKKVNDCHGHQAGDEVLKAFARLLENSFRASDICCRFGGEEFLVLLPETGERAALARVEQVRAALESKDIVAGEAHLRITASFGVAAFPEHATSAEALIAAADEALYAAKHGGRNRVFSFGALTPPGGHG